MERGGGQRAKPGGGAGPGRAEWQSPRGGVSPRRRSPRETRKLGLLSTSLKADGTRQSKSSEAPCPATHGKRMSRAATSMAGDHSPFSLRLTVQIPILDQRGTPNPRLPGDGGAALLGTRTLSYPKPPISTSHTTCTYGLLHPAQTGQGWVGLGALSILTVGHVGGKQGPVTYILQAFSKKGGFTVRIQVDWNATGQRLTIRPSLQTICSHSPRGRVPEETQPLSGSPLHSPLVSGDNLGSISHPPFWKEIAGLA